MTVDVVIVHYGPPEVTKGAVREVLRTRWPLTVVDNDGELDLHSEPRARVLRPGTNLGFGRAANLAARQGSAPWILLLNPDTDPEPEALARLVAIAADHDDTAVLAPTLVYGDGSPQIGGGRFAGWVREVGRISGLGRRLRARRAQVAPEFRASSEPGGSATIDREWVSGAVIVVRRSAFEEVGGFDERFFLYYEDEDLCRRLRARGWRVAVTPGVRVAHTVMGTRREEKAQTPLMAYERSRALYHQIHSGPLLRRIVGWDSARRERALR